MENTHGSDPADHQKLYQRKRRDWRVGVVGGWKGGGGWGGECTSLTHDVIVFCVFPDLHAPDISSFVIITSSCQLLERFMGENRKTGHYSLASAVVFLQELHS